MGDVQTTREQREAAVRAMYGSSGVERHAAWIADREDDEREEMEAFDRELLVSGGIARLLATREAAAVAAEREACAVRVETLPQRIATSAEERQVLEIAAAGIRARSARSDAHDTATARGEGGR